MKNPAEELVTAWLQECKEFFTMNNIKAQKRKGEKGSHPEIDILAMKRRNKVWVEVDVSIKPWHCKYEEMVDKYAKIFENKNKIKKVRELFGDTKYQKWLVCGKLSVEKRRGDFKSKMLSKHKIHIIDFEIDVLNELTGAIKEYRLDTARNYTNLFKTFKK